MTSQVTMLQQILGKSFVTFQYNDFVFSSKDMKDPLMVDDDPFYAKAKEISNVQVQNGMQASGSKSESAFGRGKKSRKCWNS